ncbi:hypothetical protein ACHAPX_003524 [Trichoderma viride]
MSTFGGPVTVVQPQGRFSYTVSARNDTVIIQFREQDSPLLLTAVTALLSRAHGELVPSFSRVGTLGGQQEGGLEVYTMNKLPGVNYSYMAESLPSDENTMMNFVDSLASFFAQAWTRGRPDYLTSQEHGDLAATCRARLDALSESLPGHLIPVVAQVRENMDRLFSGSYPIVLTHGDLGEMNMLVDPDSGALTGVVDWAEASLLPFGFSLYALDSVLGDMYLTGWTYHENADQARRRFWDTFSSIEQPSHAERQQMEVARLAGILFRYGTLVSSGFPGMLGIRGEDNGSLAFLEAFI